MSGEYNSNLLQAQETSGLTVEPDTRYEYSDDLNRLDKTIGNVENRWMQKFKADNKAQEHMLETQFDKEIAEALYQYQRTPNAPRSELDANINTIIERYPTLSMSTKTSIMHNRNYRSPLVSAVEASEISTKKEAENTAKRDAEYMALTNASYSPEEIANMSDEYKKQEGKRLYSEKAFTIQLGGMLNSDLSSNTKEGLATVTAGYLESAIAKDIKKNIDLFSPEWFGRYKILATKSLIADGVPPEYANIIVSRASEPFETLATGIKQSREDLIKSVEQRNTFVEKTVETNEYLSTGLTQGRERNLVEMYPYLTDKKDRDFVKQIPLQLARTGQQNQILLSNLGGPNISAATPQMTYDIYNSLFNNSLATANQKMNVATAGLQGMSQYVTNQGNGMTPEEKQRAGEQWAKENSYNFRTLYNQLLEQAPALKEAFKENADEAQKQNITEQFRTSFKLALDNQMRLLGLETDGAISYVDDYFVSDRKSDMPLIEETNDLLEAIWNINEALGGEILDADEIDTLIKQGMSKYSLAVPGSKTIGQQVSEFLIKPLGWIGRHTNNPDYEFLSLGPREAVMLQNDRKQLQQDAVENLRKTTANVYYGANTYVPKREAVDFWDSLDPKNADKVSKERVLAAELAYAGTAPYWVLKSLYNAPAAIAKRIQERKDLQGLSEKEEEAIQLLEDDVRKDIDNRLEELYNNLYNQERVQQL